MPRRRRPIIQSEISTGLASPDQQDRQRANLERTRRQKKDAAIVRRMRKGKRVWGPGFSDNTKVVVGGKTYRHGDLSPEAIVSIPGRQAPPGWATNDQLTPSQRRTFASRDARANAPELAKSRAFKKLFATIGGQKGGGYQGSSFGGGILGNLVADVSNATLGFPAGLVKIEEAARKDVSSKEWRASTAWQLKHPSLRWHQGGPKYESHLQKDVLEPIGKNYKHTYGPAAGLARRLPGGSHLPGAGRGNLGKTLHRIGQHPLGPILDVATVVSGGTTGVVKAGNLLTKGERFVVPTERIVRYHGGHAQPHASPNTLVRIIQHKKDRAAEAHPESPLVRVPLGKGKVTSKIPIGLTVGARRAVTKRLPYELEREFERSATPSIRLNQARQFLRKPGHLFAYDVLLRYGDKALERIDQEIAFREKRRAGEVKMNEKIAQTAQILGLKAAKKHLQNPSRRLVKAVDAGRDLTHMYQDTKIALGELHPASAAPRVHQPSRLVTGGEFGDVVEFKGFKPGKMQPGAKAARTGADSLTRLQMLETELAKSTKAYEETKGQMRPRTEVEARHRQQILEEDLVDSFKQYARDQLGIAKGDPFKGFGDAKEQLRRNRTNYLLKELQKGKRHKGAARAMREGFARTTAKGDQLQEFADEFFRTPAGGEKLAALETTEQGLHDLAAFKKGEVKSKPPTEADEFDKLFGSAPDKGGQGGSVGSGVRPVERPGAPPAAAVDELAARRRKNLEDQLVAQKALHARAPEGPIKAKIAAQIAGIEHKLEHDLPEPAPIAGQVPEILPGQRTIDQGLRAVAMPRKPSAEHYRSFLGEEPAPHNARAAARAALLRELRDKELRRWDSRKPIRQEVKKRYEVVGRELRGGEVAGEGAVFVADVANQAIRGILSRTAGVLGKQQKARYQYQSEGKLFTEGRIRRGPAITLEEFHLTRRRAQQAADRLRASSFAKELNADSATWRDPDFVFFNPNAHKIPRGVREDPAQAVLGMTPQELAQADKAFFDDMFPNRIDLTDIEKARAAGVMQVHQAVASAFQQQAPLFVGARMLPALGRATLGILDASNNMTRLGLLYLKGSFVPANYAGNVLFLGIQQGPHVFKSLMRGSTLLRLTRDSTWAPLPLRKAIERLSDLDAETIKRLDIEVGTGASMALVSGKGPLGALGSAVGHGSNVLSDRGPRRAAILYEFEKRGYKTDKQIRGVLDDPSKRAVLNQIAEEAENAMVRFRGLSKFEREVLSRLIFIYPWLKGATRYGWHLGKDHPGKALIVNAIGQEGHDEMIKKLGQLVSYMEHLIPAGEARKEFGTTVIPVRSPLSITPIGTFGEVLAMGQGLGSADVPPSQRPIRYIQPAIRAGLEAISGVNISRGYAYQGKSPADILADVTVRQYPLVRSIQTINDKPQTEDFTGSPAKQPLYVKEGGWRSAAEQLFLPARKRLLNLPAAHAKAAGEFRAALSDKKRVLYDDQQFRKELIHAAKVAKAPKMLDAEYKLDKPLREAITWLTRRNIARIEARDKKGQALNSFEKWNSDAQLAVKYKLMTPAQYAHHTTRVKAIWENPKLAASRRDGKITREVTNMGLALFGRSWLDQALEVLRDRGHEIKRPSLAGS